MRLRVVVSVCVVGLLLGSWQAASAQDLGRYYKPGVGLTPEARKFLQQSREFKTLTPEEVERGKAELERLEVERKRQALAAKEKEKEEVRRISEISKQEKELRYIASKYRDRAIRDIYVSVEDFIDNQLIKQNVVQNLASIDPALLETYLKRLDMRSLNRDLQNLDMTLLDVLDRYQEEVVHDIDSTFQLQSAYYGDAASRLRDIFTQAEKAAVAKIKDFVRIQTGAGKIITRGPPQTKIPTGAAARTQPSTDPIGRIFQGFMQRVTKEILDNFTLKWAAKDILRPYKEELPYARPVKELHLFGHEIFSRPPETFTPPPSMPVSQDYLIGPGDQIKVLIWGRFDAEYSLVVNRDGTIQFPRIGTISVAGLTYKEMRRLLKKKAESITGVNLSVTMGRLRSITVFVVGEVKKPGAYTVSAFDTMINALLISGGPTDLGSLRNVQLKRKDRIVTAVDFYDFLLKGNTSRDRRLRPGDVVFVPKAENLVAVAGNVKRPAVYELRGDLSLAHLIDLAGGLAPSAYKQRLQIERSFENQKRVVLDVTYDGRRQPPAFTLQDGDVVKVFPIAPARVEAVYLYGNVLRPGSYAYRPGMQVSDVIRDETELKSDTDFSYALIKRYVEPDMHAELIPFNLGRAILARSEKSNVGLKPYDEIYIFNKWLFTYRRYARIKGEIRNPGNYPLQEKMRIKDLIIAAGGLRREAYLGKCHLFRTDPLTKKVSMLTFNLQKVLEDDRTNNLPLQDQDQVVIHSIREYKPRQYVSIYGMVNRPGEYPLAVGMTIKDLIMAGGNLRQEAYRDQAELVRFKLVDGELMKTEVHTFNVTGALAGEPQENLKLRDFDRVFIKKIPKWLEEIRVNIDGEVKYPGQYFVREGEKLSSLIERAGGFTEEAYLRGSFFTRERARKMQRQRLNDLILKMEQEIAAAEAVEVMGALSKEEMEAHRVALEAKKGLLKRLKAAKVQGRMVVKLAPLKEFKNSKYDLRLENGDRLVIPKVPQFVNVMGEVYNPTSFLYEKGKKVSYYLNRAGGPTANAEKGQMYIIRADGSVLSKAQSGTLFGWDSDNHRWTYGGFKSARLYPGDTVLVPRKLVKIHWLKEVRDITQVMFQIAVTTGVLLAI